MKSEGYPAGTTESERRESQEFERPIRRDDEVWTAKQLAALTQCLKDLEEDDADH